METLAKIGLITKFSITFRAGDRVMALLGGMCVSFVF